MISTELLESVLDGTYVEPHFEVTINESELSYLLDEDGQLMENIFSGMPSSVIKAIVGNRGGAGSEVAQETAKNKSKLRAAINDGLKGGAGIVVMRGNNMVASMSPGSSYKDTEFNVFDEAGDIRKHDEVKHYRGRAGKYYAQTHTVTNYPKGRAIDMIIDKIEMSGGFSEDITVKSFKIDAARLKTREERKELRRGSGGEQGLIDTTIRAAEALVAKYIQRDYSKTVDESIAITKEIVKHMKDENLQQMLFEAKRLTALLEKEVNSVNYKNMQELAQRVMHNAADVRRYTWSKDSFVQGLQRLKKEAEKQS